MHREHRIDTTVPWSRAMRGAFPPRSWQLTALRVGAFVTVVLLSFSVLAAAIPSANGGVGTAGQQPALRALLDLPLFGPIFELTISPVARVVLVALGAAALVFGALSLFRNEGPRDEATQSQPARPAGDRSTLEQAMADHTAAGTPEQGPTLERLVRLRTRSARRLEEVSRLLDAIESEAAPLMNLLAQQDELERRFAENLRRTLSPLLQYANGREENLQRLLAPGGADASGAPSPMQHAVDAALERQQIEQIRADIARQERTLRAQFAIERQAINAALAVFDSQIDTLEEQMGGAQRTAGRMNDGMHSAAFVRTLDFLGQRAERLSALAAAGGSNTRDLDQEAPTPVLLSVDDTELAAQTSSYLRPVLDTLRLGGAPAATAAAGRTTVPAA